MGSSSTKKLNAKGQAVKGKAINRAAQDLLPIESLIMPEIADTNTESNVKLSKYLTSKKEVLSPAYLIDQASGCPLLLHIPTQKTELVNYPIPLNSRCLYIPENKILITSLQSTLILELPSQKLTYLPQMNQRRENHSLLVFNSKILATGGSCSEDLASCEIFSQDRWENISKLNIARSWHSSIDHNSVVYVFGGLKTNTIEKLRGRWELLPIKLPWNLNRLGLAPLSEGILITGGEVLGQGYSSASWVLVFSTCSLLTLKPCPVQSLYYSQGGYIENSAVLFTTGLQLYFSEIYKSWEIYS